MTPMFDLLLEAAATAFWGLALVIGIILALSLFLGILTQAKYEQQRKKWAKDIKPGRVDSI